MQRVQSRILRVAKRQVARSYRTKENYEVQIILSVRIMLQ